MPKLRKNHSQMDSFNFKITPKNYFSENDQIFNSENSYRENNKSFRRKLKIYTENETNTIKSFDSVAKIISPKTLSKELKENEREMVMFQSGFSDISQISKMEAFERKEESKKDSNSNKLLINNKKINKETSREKKNKDSSEASFKINETTRIGKKLNKNHSSNTMNTSRSLVNNFRQNKINYSTNHNSTKNIFQDQKKSLMKSKNEPKAFLDQEINKGVIIDSSLNNIVDSNDLPGLKNTKTKSVNTSTTSSKIKNIPKCMSLLTPSKKTTKLEKGESNNKKVIKKNNSHFLGNKIQDILKHKEEPQYTPYNLKSKFNNPVAINSKKMELSSNYSEKKLEKKEDKSKLITDTIKNFPNLKKTIEKTLKRPLSYNSPKIV